MNKGEGAILPDAGWRHMPGLAKLCRLLGAEEGLTRLVGGAVRDGLAGQPVKDVDLATVLSPDEVMARLKAAKIKVIPTGLAHGTVTAVVHGNPFEVTTLRRDVATDGRRATIAYTDDWQQDAARRDVTINALYADPATGVIHDYFGGVDDLAAGQVRFIGEPLQRIAEDHLRILRFFRFQARYGAGAPDAAALHACAARANDLMALSRERIADEMLKMLALPDPSATVALMLAHGILKPVLPEIKDAAPLERLVAAEARAGIAPAPLRRLAALLPAKPVTVTGIAFRLKLSKAAHKRLAAAAARTTDDAANPRALAYRAGVEAAIDRLLLAGIVPDALVDWTPPVFPLKGGAIVASGIVAGPEVARIMQAAEAQWIAEGFPDAARVRAIVDGLVDESR
jgi:poly(A) polymerase